MGWDIWGVVRPMGRVEVPLHSEIQAGCHWSYGTVMAMVLGRGYKSIFFSTIVMFNGYWMNDYKLRITCFVSSIFNKFVQSLKPSKTRSDNSNKTVLTLVEVLLKKNVVNHQIFIAFFLNVDITSHIQRIKQQVVIIIYFIFYHCSFQISPVQIVWHNGDLRQSE